MITLTFVSKLLPHEMAIKLQIYTKIKRLEPSKAITSELKYHPDIICSQLQNSLYMCADSIQSGMNAVAVNSIKDGYPNDCVLNNLITDRYVIAGKRTALAYSDEDICGREIIRVNQGYVKCSVVSFGDRFITSDRSIADKLMQLDYEVLLIDNDGIKLNGFNCGFIGGATAVIDNKLFVFGDITKHKAHDMITEFALRSVDDIISFGNGDIYDYGGAVTVDTDDTEDI